MSALQRFLGIAAGSALRKISVRLACCTAVLGLSVLAEAQCKSGFILNQTWTKAQSPICVNGDIDIGGTLTIEAGVRVEFEGNYEIRTGSGKIVAKGTKFDPIVFTSSDPSTIWWKGFGMLDSPAGSEFRFCVIEWSDRRAITMHGTTVPPIISDSTFQNNTDASTGGAVYVNLDAGNTLRMDRCLFKDNAANPSNEPTNAYGGAIRALGEGSIELHDCTFKGNGIKAQSVQRDRSREAYGGAIYLDPTLSNVRIIRCEFRGNSAETHTKGDFSWARARGGGVYSIAGSLNILNSLFSDNWVAASANYPGIEHVGTALCVNNASDATVTNSTIARNRDYSAIQHLNGSIKVQNSIVYYNGTEHAGTVEFEYSNVQGPTPPPGPGNINTAPGFIGGAGDTSRVHLTAYNGAPGMNMGNPGSEFYDCGIGSTAPYGVQYPFPPERNDMGMHGGPEGCGWAPACLADFDKSTGPSVLDIFDFLEFQNAFVAQDSYACNCDISTGIDVCDIFDFLAFQNAFVAGCP